MSANFRLRELPAARAVLAAPTPEDLAAIAEPAFAGVPVTADDVHTGMMRLAHDQYDRTGERFTRAILDRFAETLPGKSMMPGHDYRALPLGRFYKADVAGRTEEFACLQKKAADTIPGFEAQKTKVAWLNAGYYFPNDPSSEGMRKAIGLGVWKDVSIGFSFDDLRCDSCGKSYFSADCPHILMAPDEEGNLVTGTYSGDPQKYEAQEGSVVWLGAQQQAELGKSLVAGEITPERYAYTPWGPDLVKLKQGEALARKHGIRCKSWAFPGLEDKAVCGATGLPLSARDRAWDAGAAEGRVRSWAGAEDAPNAKYRRAFFYYDPEHADQFGSVKLGFADPINGELTAVWRGVTAVAAVLQGSRGGVEGLSDSDRAGIKSKVESYYAKARREYSDDSIQVPWSGSGASAADYHGQAEGNALMFEFKTEEELLAAEPVKAAVAKAASDAAAAEAEKATAAAGERDALKPLADIGTKALEDLTATYVGHVVRLGGDEGEAKAVAELFVSKGDYAGLKERVEKKWAAVCEKYPVGLVGDPTARGDDPPAKERDPIPAAAYLA